MQIPLASWQEMIGTLPPGEQAEIGALLTERGEDKTAADDTTT